MCSDAEGVDGGSLGCEVAGTRNNVVFRESAMEYVTIYGKETSGVVGKEKSDVVGKGKSGVVGKKKSGVSVVQW